jgi:hypothetical protein
MKTSLVAACALSFVAGSAAFMAPSPSITRSAFAPAVGVQSRSKVMNAAPVKAGRIALRPRGAASGISKLHMGKVKAEYIWIGGRGGVGDDYRYVCYSVQLSLCAKDDSHRDLDRTCLRITLSCFALQNLAFRVSSRCPAPVTLQESRAESQASDRPASPDELCKRVRAGGEARGSDLGGFS